MVDNFRVKLYNFIGDYMSFENRILEMLEKSEKPISGEHLAAKFSVSRNSVWKAVNSLREQGYKINAIPNKGYFLAVDNTALSEYAVNKRLKKPRKITVYKTAPSTNTLAKKLAESGSEEGRTIIAESQTAGRGRLGRQFFSPEGGGLYMSIILRPTLPTDQTSLITTAAAVAVCRAIENVFGMQAKIKWVNDIFAHGKKVCGILTEGAINFETGKLDYAVLGIGINISSPKGGFPTELKHIAGSLLTRNCTAADKSGLAASILDNFFDIYENIESREFMKEYQSRSLVLGRNVKFTKNDKEYSGVAEIIDDNAHLSVRLQNGELYTLFAGEVSLKI